jgi:hypothetical protein
MLEKVIFSEEECNSIIALADKFQFPKFRWGDYWDMSNPILDEFLVQPECSVFLNHDQRKYFLEKFKPFKLKSFPKRIKILKYTEGIGMKMHIDNRGTDGKLKSICVQLSPSINYEGGNLGFLLNNKIVEASREVGNSIMFSCSVRHRISPVTTGVRYSVVIWLREENLLPADTLL